MATNEERCVDCGDSQFKAGQRLVTLYKAGQTKFTVYRHKVFDFACGRAVIIQISNY